MLRPFVWMTSVAAAVHAAACNSAILADLEFQQLGNGPLSLRSVIVNGSACVQVELKDQTAKWFAIAVAKTSRMINSPPTNAILYTVDNAKAALYGLHEASPSGVRLQSDQSSLKVVESVNANGQIRLTYERPLAAHSSLDVPIVEGVPTIVNWAVGFSQFPDYHDRQGSSKITFLSKAAPLCSEDFLSKVAPVKLGDGPLTIRSAFSNPSTACIQVTMQHPTATWFGVSFAPSTNMINTPTNNALVYFAPNNSVGVYDLRHAAPDQVILASNQTKSYTILKHSSANNRSTIVFERKLAAAAPTDVAISTSEPTILNWAVGFSSVFPDYHDLQGSTYLQFSSSKIVEVSSPTDAPTTTSAPPATKCNIEAVGATTRTRLGTGPISIQGKIVGSTACILVTSDDASLKWFGISFAPTQNMINTPTNNAIIYQATNNSVQVYDLRDAAPDSVAFASTKNNSFKLLQVTASEKKIQYFFERPVEAIGATDVAIATGFNTPTIVNWALGTSTFPDYHDVQGSSNLLFSSYGVIDADQQQHCTSSTFDSLAAVPLSEDNSLSLKYSLFGESVCLQVIAKNPNVTWFALAISPTPNMINERTNNALVYFAHNASAHLYDLHDASPDSVVYSPDQSSVKVISTSVQNGEISLVFERPLQAVSLTDVPISPSEPTYLNWALGFTTFPDYHDIQGTTEVTFDQILKSTPSCTSKYLENVVPVALGPLTLKYAPLGTNVCFQVSVNSSQATWFALSVSPAQNMINKPTNNAIVFQLTNNSGAIYDLVDSAPDSVIYHPDQSPLSVVETSTVNGKTVVTFQRPIAAVLPTDVKISTTNGTYLNWAVGTTSWPDYHDVQGSTEIFVKVIEVSATFPSASHKVTTKSSFVDTYTIYIVGITIALMAFLGLVATHGGEYRFINHQRLSAPPRHNHPFFADLAYSIADLKVGEVVIVVLYLVCFVLVGVFVLVQFPDVTISRQVVLVSGHLSLVSLMFILLPVARGKHWELIFGVSHERLIKFHRWLGRVFVVTATVHLIYNSQLVLYSKSFGNQQVVPIFGFLAYCAFLSMAILAYETIRRQYFEVFYYYHRVASIAGLVFILLHSQVIRNAMIVPIAVYALSLAFRSRGFFNKYQARIHTHLPGTVIFTLPVTEQTKTWAATMNPCSFFWINIPSVSLLQWHPFSAIVTPDGQSIAFCMKSLKAGSFVDQVVAQANANLVTITLFVGGPYGKPAVDFTKYDEVILISGGIGVTPMLSLVNQLPHLLPTSLQASISIQFHWVVRSSQELLTADSLMFMAPFSDIVSPRFYVDGGDTDGSIVSSSGQTISYIGGRPNLDKIFNKDTYLGKRVCVYVCGPPGLARSVQTYAHTSGFDFHKEVFEY